MKRRVVAKARRKCSDCLTASGMLGACARGERGCVGWLVGVDCVSPPHPPSFFLFSRRALLLACLHILLRCFSPRVRTHMHTQTAGRETQESTTQAARRQVRLLPYPIRMQATLRIATSQVFLFLSLFPHLPPSLSAPPHPPPPSLTEDNHEAGRPRTRRSGGASRQPQPSAAASHTNEPPGHVLFLWPFGRYRCDLVVCLRLSLSLTHTQPCVSGVVWCAARCVCVRGGTLYLSFCLSAGQGSMLTHAT